MRGRKQKKVLLRESHPWPRTVGAESSLPVRFVPILLRRVAARSGPGSGSFPRGRATRLAPALGTAFGATLGFLLGIAFGSGTRSRFGTGFGAGSRPGLGTRAGSSTASVLRQPDASAIELGVVEGVERPFHSFSRFEFDDAFVTRLLVSVGVRHLTRLSHVIL